MKESVLTMLRPCKDCKKLTYNKDGYCDTCPEEPAKVSDKYYEGDDEFQIK
jgi:RNA polymerase subunit RPABC4/transcription elongation factor Spt4